MAEYRISERARRRLAETYAHTEMNYGRLQADAYHAGFEKLFELIASFPGIYSVVEGQVVIQTIIHTAQDLRPDLFD